VADAKEQGQSHSQLERTEVTAGAPYLRVIRGDATAEEIAALVATLTAVAAARSAAAAAERAGQAPVGHNWNSRARLLRTPVYPAAGGWRRSALP
jgi:Acyl-CoA carboxylase epsilon subunit